MPSGFTISRENRQRIADLFVVEGKTENDIWCTVFDSDESIIQLETVKKICRSLRNWSSTEIDHWIDGERRQRGRLKIFDEALSDALLTVTAENPSLPLDRLLDALLERIFGDNLVNDFHLSTDTISRELHRRGWSRKVVTRRNINANPTAQVEFLEAIDFVDPEYLVSVDGMAHNAKDFEARYGWAPTSEEVAAVQV